MVPETPDSVAAEKTPAPKLKDLRAPMTADEQRQTEAMLAELANAREAQDLEQFHGRYPGLTQEAQRVIPTEMIGNDDLDKPLPLRILAFLSYLVRRLWVGDDIAIAKLEAILFSPDRSLSKISWPILLDWRRGSFIYQPWTELQRALYQLVRSSDRLKMCANYDCPHPYFIGPRGNERYCSDACFEAGRFRAKKAWWGEHGEQWRAAREKLKRDGKKARRRK
jgi:hypothetical protein